MRTIANQSSCLGQLTTLFQLQAKYRLLQFSREDMSKVGRYIKIVRNIAQKISCLHQSTPLFHQHTNYSLQTFSAEDMSTLPSKCVSLKVSEHPKGRGVWYRIPPGYQSDVRLPSIEQCCQQNITRAMILSI